MLAEWIKVHSEWEDKRESTKRISQVRGLERSGWVSKVVYGNFVTQKKKKEKDVAHQPYHFRPPGSELICHFSLVTSTSSAPPRACHPVPHRTPSGL